MIIVEILKTADYYTQNINRPKEQKYNNIKKSLLSAIIAFTTIISFTQTSKGPRNEERPLSP